MSFYNTALHPFVLSPIPGNHWSLSVTLTFFFDNTFCHSLLSLEFCINGITQYALYLFIFACSLSSMLLCELILFFSIAEYYIPLFRYDIISLYVDLMIVNIYIVSILGYKIKAALITVDNSLYGYVFSFLLDKSLEVEYLGQGFCWTF